MTRLFVNCGKVYGRRLDEISAVLSRGRRRRSGRGVERSRGGVPREESVCWWGRRARFLGPPARSRSCDPTRHGPRTHERGLLRRPVAEHRGGRLSVSADSGRWSVVRIAGRRAGEFGLPDGIEVAVGRASGGLEIPSDRRCLREVAWLSTPLGFTVTASRTPLEDRPDRRDVRCLPYRGPPTCVRPVGLGQGRRFPWPLRASRLTQEQELDSGSPSSDFEYGVVVDGEQPPVAWQRLKRVALGDSQDGMVRSGTLGTRAPVRDPA